jgi:hypothetical protein
VLTLNRAQILAHRRRVQALDEKLPPGPESLRQAAWAGLQDSVPRSALLSIHARVAGSEASAWEDPAFVQLWGLRFTAFVVPAQDRAAFSLGRLPDDARGRDRAEDLAERLDAFLAGRRMGYREAGRGIGVEPNALRYAAATGKVLIRWEGARQPTVWTVPAPDVTPHEARLELARRYLHLYGPSMPSAFARWAGLADAGARAAFESLRGSLITARTPIGDGWILTQDEASFTGRADPVAGTRLLPSGDPYFLLWGADRELLVPEADRRALLWTSRVWPGAVLAGGEIVGTWRRANAAVTLELWRPLSRDEREGLDAEVASMPLAGAPTRIASVN